MEKLRSGQSFLYRSEGYTSTVIDVRMKEKVIGSYLTRALGQALQRYPYFTSKLVEQKGNYYLEEDPISMTAIKTDKSRVLGSISTGYHLLDVTYTGDKICVAFHHALCDGRGIKPFIETLIYYYCSFRYNKKLDSTGIHLADEPLLEGETQEPFGNSYYEVDQEKVYEVSKESFRLPESDLPKEDHYRTEIKINQHQFVALSKENQATPAVMVSMIVSKSIKNLYPEADKPILCSMAADYRNIIGMENTHKNCVGSVYLPYTDETDNMSLEEQGSYYRDLIKKQKSPDSIKNALNAQIGLYNKLDTAETLEEKRKMMSFFDSLTVDTYIISYLGQFNLESCKAYIDSIHLYSSGTKGLIVNMTAVGDYITLDVLQHFDSRAIVEGIQAVLEEHNIDYVASDLLSFETKKDKAFITASRQAERRYKSY